MCLLPFFFSLTGTWTLTSNVLRRSGVETMLKQINKSATVAWSPSSAYPNLLAGGTAAGTVDNAFDFTSTLEIYDVKKNDEVLSPLGSVACPDRFNKVRDERPWTSQNVQLKRWDFLCSFVTDLRLTARMESHWTMLHFLTDCWQEECPMEQSPFGILQKSSGIDDHFVLIDCLTKEERRKLLFLLLFLSSIPFSLYWFEFFFFLLHPTLRSGEGALITTVERHTSPVQAVDFNSAQTNLLASGAHEVCSKAKSIDQTQKRISFHQSNNRFTFGIWTTLPIQPSTHPERPLSSRLIPSLVLHGTRRYFFTSFWWWLVVVCSPVLCSLFTHVRIVVTKVAHILASAFGNGSCVIWDLKNKRPVLTFADPNRRQTRWRAVAWNPEVRTNHPSYMF